jgi:hypothetical protein
VVVKLLDVRPSREDAFAVGDGEIVLDVSGFGRPGARLSIRDLFGSGRPEKIENVLYAFRFRSGLAYQGIGVRRLVNVSY